MPLLDKDKNRELELSSTDLGISSDPTDLKISLMLLALAINAVEFFIPRIPLFPWLKPGLANIVTIIWIIRYGFLDTLLFVLLRIWIISFYFGFSFITFTLGFSGALCACAAMTLVWQILGKRQIIGMIGLGIIGALFHNFGQLVAVYMLMAQNYHLFYQIPVMIFASLFFGSLVGVMVPYLMKLLSSSFASRVLENVSLSSQAPKKPDHFYLSLLLLGICFTLIFIRHLPVLVFSALGITFLVQCLEKKLNSNYLFLPIKRFWLMFLFIGSLHLFFTYGRKVPLVPLITYEGLDATIAQWLKLWTWLQTSIIFFKFRFHILLMTLLEKIFRTFHTTLYAGVIAAEYFPSVIDSIRSKSGKLVKLLVRKPHHVIGELVTMVREIATGSSDFQDKSDANNIVSKRKE